MKSQIAIVSLLIAAGAALAVEYIESIALKQEPVDDGSQVLTAVFAPAKSQTYSQIVFESVYQQTYPFQDSAGRRRLKTVEPVRHVYRRADVKLVDDLDKHISFRLPVDIDKLNARYGPGTFDAAYPLKIDRVIITAYSATGKVWGCSVKPGEVMTNAPTAKESKPAAGKDLPDSATFGEIDLD